MKPWPFKRADLVALGPAGIALMSSEQLSRVYVPDLPTLPADVHAALCAAEAKAADAAEAQLAQLREGLISNRALGQKIKKLCEPLRTGLKELEERTPAVAQELIDLPPEEREAAIRAAVHDAFGTPDELAGRVIEVLQPGADDLEIDEDDPAFPADLDGWIASRFKAELLAPFDEDPYWRAIAKLKQYLVIAEAALQVEALESQHPLLIEVFDEVPAAERARAFDRYVSAALAAAMPESFKRRLRVGTNGEASVFEAGAARPEPVRGRDLGPAELTMAERSQLARLHGVLRRARDTDAEESACLALDAARKAIADRQRKDADQAAKDDRWLPTYERLKRAHPGWKLTRLADATAAALQMHGAGRTIRDRVRALEMEQTKV